MNANALSAASSGRPLTGRGVLLILLVFFGVVFTVDFYMAHMALATFSGEVDKHPYEVGLAYNKAIAAARAQDELGWRISADLGAVSGGRSSVTLRATESTGAPLRGLRVSLTLRMPVAQSEDTRVDLVETAAGVYNGVIAAAPGVREVIVDARDETGDKRFLSRNRIDLR